MVTERLAFDRKKNMRKRFLVCKLDGPAEGKFDPKTEAVDGADFDTWEEARAFVGSFPGTGNGYIYDSSECCVVHLVAWERKAPAN